MDYSFVTGRENHNVEDWISTDHAGLHGRHEDRRLESLFGNARR